MVRLATREIRNDILHRRRALKGTPISISEDLCTDVYKELQRVKKSPQVAQSWTWNGKVFIKTRSDHIFKVLWGQSVDEVIQQSRAWDKYTCRLILLRLLIYALQNYELLICLGQWYCGHRSKMLYVTSCSYWYGIVWHSIMYMYFVKLVKGLGKKKHIILFWFMPSLSLSTLYTCNVWEIAHDN